MIRIHEDEHFEVQVQSWPGDRWHTFTGGPHVLYPDLDSAAEYARKLGPVSHAVRVKHVMADYYDPAGLPGSSSPHAPEVPSRKENRTLWLVNGLCG